MKKFKKVKVGAPGKAVVRKFVAKPAAYVTLITTSAYGIQMMLKPLSSGVALFITILIVLGACYILVEE